MRFLSQAQGTVRIMASEGRSLPAAHDVAPHPARVLVGGGIGAGKSSVMAVFADAGYHVIVADDVGRSVLSPGASAVTAVARLWPDVVHQGVVDRRALADIVFADAPSLATLETITHPIITEAITAEIEEHRTEAVCVEIPVMGMLDAPIWHRIAVVAPGDIRLARAVSRGGDADDIRRRMASQPDDHAWRSWADTVIDNGGAWADTERFVAHLVEGLRER